jgi:hypothetical protein
MRSLLVLFLVAALSGVSGVARASEHDEKSDYVAVLREALMVLGRQEGSITVFIPPADADRPLIEALKTFGVVVPRTAIPSSKKYTLPKGYFIVEYVHIKDGIGHVRGIVGPGALKGTLGADEDCGARYYISLWFKDGKWENGPYSKQDCHTD